MPWDCYERCIADADPETELLRVYTTRLNLAYVALAEQDPNAALALWSTMRESLVTAGLRPHALAVSILTHTLLMDWPRAWSAFEELRVLAPRLERDVLWALRQAGGSAAGSGAAELETAIREFVETTGDG